MKKKICCFLAALMLFFSLPIKAQAKIDITEQEIDFVGESFFAVQFSPEPSGKSDVLEKLEKVKSLKGKYFTVSKSYCAGIPGENVHGCSNCESTNLIKTDLYDIMPDSINHLPKYHRYTGGIAQKCWSCAAFASITHWYLYAKKSSDTVTVNKISWGEFGPETLSKAMPGDIIALSYASSGSHFHSMIFLEQVSGGIRVLDCNWSTGTYGNCIVQERTMTYSSKYTVAVSRSSSYEEEKKAVTGVEIVDKDDLPVENITLEIGEEIELSAKITPDDAYDKTVLWSSNNTSVAEASAEGKVIAIGAGTAEIKVTSNDGGCTDICTVEIVEPKESLLGDVDGNGKINILDANLIRRYTAKMEELNEKQLKAADVDGSGKVNAVDANLIRRYVAKIIIAFPVEE